MKIIGGYGSHSPGAMGDGNWTVGTYVDERASAEQRVIVASFSSHIHRIQQVCDAAVGAGRKVVVTGRSMVTNTKIARELGYLDIDDENILDAYETFGHAASTGALKVIIEA